MIFLHINQRQKFTLNLPIVTVYLIEREAGVVGVLRAIRGGDVPEERRAVLMSQTPHTHHCTCVDELAATRIHCVTPANRCHGNRKCKQE